MEEGEECEGGEGGIHGWLGCGEAVVKGGDGGSVELGNRGRVGRVIEVGFLTLAFCGLKRVMRRFCRWKGLCGSCNGGTKEGKEE